MAERAFGLEDDDEPPRGRVSVRYGNLGALGLPSDDTALEARLADIERRLAALEARRTGEDE